MPSLPRISIIAAMTRDRVIGSSGRLPWVLHEDLRLFRRLTTGNTVIMGRRTFESIGHPLPERTNIILSRTRGDIPGAKVCSRFVEALKVAADNGPVAFVIGGADVYRQALSLASEMHISWVRQEYHGDTMFPRIDLNEWTISEEEDYSDFLYAHYLRKGIG